VKPAIFHPGAVEALRTFPVEVRRALGKAIYDLQNGHLLSMPLSRPMSSVGPGASELRIRDDSGSYRAFYVVKTEAGVVVFHAFVKKSQKTPARELETGKKRFKEMMR